MTHREQPLSANERRVIVARRHGWEAAPIGDLATIFRTTPQHISSICRTSCASCGERICDCTDDAWLGGRA